MVPMDIEAAKRLIPEVMPVVEAGANSESTEEAQYFLIGFATAFALPVEREQLATWLEKKNFQCVISVLNGSAGSAGSAGSSTVAPRRRGAKSTLEQWRDDGQRRERAKQLLIKNGQLDLGAQVANQKAELIVCGIAAVYINPLTPDMISIICSRLVRNQAGVQLLSYINTNILPRMDDGAGSTASASAPSA